jgi:uncharacterized protein
VCALVGGISGQDEVGICQKTVGCFIARDIRVKTLLIFAAVCMGVASVTSAEQAAPPLSTIRVTGNATVTTKPDRVDIDIGVVTQATQAQAAAAENATRLDSVLAALRKTLGEGSDIKTVSYTLTPNYHYRPAGGEPTITGYTGTNVVRITVDDLNKLGTVIDTATRAGANRVQDIRFTLRDPVAVHLQALREAAARAKAEANTLASALGVKVLRVLTVEDIGGQPTPIRPLMLATRRAEMAQEEPTPIEAGTLDVRANVTLTVEVGS